MGDEKVSPGDIIYNEKDGELKPIKSFTALVAVQEHPGVLKPGYCPVVFSRTAKVACKMTKILWKMGKKTGGAKVENPPELSQFENAEIEFEPTAPLFVEPFAVCAALGRFAVMDSNMFVSFRNVERKKVWMDPTHLWAHNTELQS